MKTIKCFTKPHSAILKTISEHPIFVIVCGIATIIGTAFGIWGVCISISKPDLTYYVSPTRTPILHTGQLEDFSLTYHGIEFTGDLSSAEIQIWNAGKSPIRRGEILSKQITLSLSNNIQIYKATVTQSREIIGFNWLKDSNPNSTAYVQHNRFLQKRPPFMVAVSNGIFIPTNDLKEINTQLENTPAQTVDVPSFYHKPPVSALVFDWDVLEQGDAIKIQIIYGGRLDAPVLLNGVMLGQKQPTEYIIESGTNHSTSTPRKLIATMLFVVLMIVSSIAGWYVKSKFHVSTPLYNFVLLVLLFAFYISIIFCGNLISKFILTASRPPFGF